MGQFFILQWLLILKYYYCYVLHVNSQSPKSIFVFLSLSIFFFFTQFVFVSLHLLLTMLIKFIISYFPAQAQNKKKYSGRLLISASATVGALLLVALMCFWGCFLYKRLGKNDSGSLAMDVGAGMIQYCINSSPSLPFKDHFWVRCGSWFLSYSTFSGNPHKILSIQVPQL